MIKRILLGVCALLLLLGCSMALLACEKTDHNGGERPPTTTVTPPPTGTPQTPSGGDTGGGSTGGDTSGGSTGGGDTTPEEVDPALWFTYNGNTLTGFTAKGWLECTALVIPQKINGQAITAIAPNAFQGNKQLVSITIPKTVVSVGEGAFAHCTALSLDGGVYYADGWAVGTATPPVGALVLPAGTVGIADAAFAGCYDITALTLPGGLQYIGNNAFSSCEGLLRVAIPRETRRIGDGAFYRCTNLNTVETVSDGQLESVGAHAFYGCAKLLHFLAPKSLKTVGDYAFYGCRKLFEVTNYAESLTVACGNESSGYLGYYALNVNRITRYGSGVQKLFFTNDGFAFYRDESVCYLVGYTGTRTELQLPTSYENTRYTIYTYAFADETRLFSVRIPTNVKDICEDAFLGCYGLIKTEEGISYVDQWVIGAAKNIEQVKLRASTVGIAARSFYNCKNIYQITIPAGVMHIGSEAFLGCDRLVEVCDAAAALVITAGDAGHGYVGYYARRVYRPELEESCLYTKEGGYVFYEDDSYCRLVAYTGEATEAVLPAARGGGKYTVGVRAFAGCNALTSVTLCAAVEAIDADAFLDCRALRAVYIEDLAAWCGITFEGITANPLSYAGRLFAGGTELSDMVIPVTVSSIGAYAFAGCTSLQSVTLPANSTLCVLGTDAFSGCRALRAVYIEDLAAWCALSFENAAANPLAVAGRLYLAGNEVRELTIPQAVTHIGANAFSGCCSLAVLQTPDSLREIGEGAFAHCYNLVSVTLGADVEAVSDDAFSYCYKLLEIYSHSEQYGVSAGYGIAKYAKLIYNYHDITTNGAPASRVHLTDDGYVFFMGIGNHRAVLMGYIGTATALTLPANVDTLSYAIYAYAFYGMDTLTSVVLPQQLLEIGDYAFSGCVRLHTLTVPVDCALGAIGTYAFENCRSLTSILLPTALQSIGHFAFSACQALVEVFDLSEALEVRLESDEHGSVASRALVVHTAADARSAVLRTPEGYVFYADGDTRYLLTYLGTDIALELPADCNGQSYEIYKNAFYGMPLTSLVVPAGVTRIGKYAFGGTGLDRVTLAEGLKRIDQNAFSACRLTSVHIPASVEMIGTSAFADCTQLTTVQFAEGTRLASLAEGAFSGCTGLVYHVYDNGKYLGTAQNPYLLLLCLTDRETAITLQVAEGTRLVINGQGKNLTLVTLSSTVESVGYRAFYKCASLESVRFSANGNLVSIAAEAFYGCAALQLCRLPDTLTTIGSSAFYGCESLISVTLPRRLSGLGSGAFGACTALTVIEINGDIAECAAAFGYTTAQAPSCVVYVGALVTAIPKSLFSGSAVASVYFETGSICTAIGDYAFASSRLTEIILPANVATVGKYAFRNCAALTAISFGSVREIGNNAFEYCTALTSVTLPSALMRIGSNAFLHCDSLTSVTMKEPAGWYVSAMGLVEMGTAVPATSDFAHLLTKEHVAQYWVR